MILHLVADKTEKKIITRRTLRAAPPVPDHVRAGIYLRGVLLEVQPGRENNAFRWGRGGGCNAGDSLRWCGGCGGGAAVPVARNLGGKHRGVLAAEIPTYHAGRRSWWPNTHGVA